MTKPNPYDVPITSHEDSYDIRDALENIAGELFLSIEQIDDVTENFAERSLGDLKLMVEVEKRRLRQAMASLEAAEQQVMKTYGVSPSRTEILWEWSDEEVGRRERKSSQGRRAR